MKRITSFLLALVAVSAFASFASAGTYTPRIDHRRMVQRERIHDGVCGGQLTRREARHLRMGERHIRSAERRAKMDGQMSMRERGRINRMQNRESRRIFRLKHNRRSA